jgi:hypothetical protein
MSDPPLQKGPGVQDIMAFYCAEDAIARSLLMSWLKACIQSSLIAT